MGTGDGEVSGCAQERQGHPRSPVAPMPPHRHLTLLTGMMRNLLLVLYSTSRRQKNV